MHRCSDFHVNGALQIFNDDDDDDVVVRSGGVCYRRCDGRVVITNVTSSGAIGSHRGHGVDDRRHVYCLWILTVSAGWDDIVTSSTDVGVTSVASSITLTVPQNNLRTACLKVGLVYLVSLVCLSVCLLCHVSQRVGLIVIPGCLDVCCVTSRRK